MHATRPVERGRRPAPKAESADGDRRPVHEDHVYAWDVQRQARGEHDARLSLPEVVDQRQRHEDQIVAGARDQCGEPDQQVRAPRAARVVEGDEGARDDDVFTEQERGAVSPTARQGLGEHLPRKVWCRIPGKRCHCPLLQ